jgi:hypothetical protein
MKQYTIGIRQKDYDEIDFIQVEALNAYQAEKEVVKKVKAAKTEPGEPTPTIYTEFIIEGYVKVLANYTSWGADTKYLKTV